MSLKIQQTVSLRPKFIKVNNKEVGWVAVFALFLPPDEKQSSLAPYSVFGGTTIPPSIASMAFFMNTMGTSLEALLSQIPFGGPGGMFYDEEAAVRAAMEASRREQQQQPKGPPPASQRALRSATTQRSSTGFPARLAIPSTDKYMSTGLDRSC